MGWSVMKRPSVEADEGFDLPGADCRRHGAGVGMGGRELEGILGISAHFVLVVWYFVYLLPPNGPESSRRPPCSDSRLVITDHINLDRIGCGMKGWES